MENVLADVKISRITIGPDPKNGMSYHVGQELNIGEKHERQKCKITRIVRDESHFHLYGCLAYVIWAEIDDTKQEFIFRYTLNMPVYVTGVLPGSDKELIVDKQFVNYEDLPEHFFDQRK